MALGTDHVTLTSAATFIPEIWSDEVIAAYKRNLVLANLITRINHIGKKGDTIHIPAPIRGEASVKNAETQVTLISNVESEVPVTIDKHYEYSRLIEDIVSKQALNSLRQFYTDDAGYALAKQVDDDLHALGATLNGSTAYSTAVIGGDGATVYDPTANTNAGNGTTLTDIGLRAMIQGLDDLDVPVSQRALVLPPVEKNTLLGLPRFTEQAFTGEMGGANSIRNGLVGDIYGMPVYVTTNCATITADDTTTDYRVGLLLHKEVFAFAEQMSVRSQTQYKQEYLSDLFTADTIYGVAELRDTSGVAFVVPA